MKVTQIEKLNQLISRTDMTGNQKVEWLTSFIDEHVTEQLRLHDVSRCNIELISSVDPLDNVGKEVYLIRDDKIIKERINKAMVTREESSDHVLNPVEGAYFFNNLGMWVDADRVYFTKEDIIKGL